MPELHFYELYGLLALILWMGTLVHCICNPRLRAGEKVGLVLAIVFLNWVGMLIYLIYWLSTRNRVKATSAPIVYTPRQIRYERQETYHAPYSAGYRPVSKNTASPGYSSQKENRPLSQKQTVKASEPYFLEDIRPKQKRRNRPIPSEPYFPDDQDEPENTSRIYEEMEIMYPEDPR